MLIANESALNRLIDAFRDDGGVSPSAYVVLGTLDAKTWREGVWGSVTIHQVKEHMADFKTYMQVVITPAHWAPRD